MIMSYLCLQGNQRLEDSKDYAEDSEVRNNDIIIAYFLEIDLP